MLLRIAWIGFFLVGGVVGALTGGCVGEDPDGSGNNGPLDAGPSNDGSSDATTDANPPVDATTCTDVTSDPQNCGKCGNVCASGACVAGTCDHIVFVSKKLFDGQLGGPAGADQGCNEAASVGKLPGTYVAWVSISTNTALARLYNGAPPPAGRWVLADRTTVVANSFSDLGQSLLHGIDQDETKNKATGQAMTNTKTNGSFDRATGGDCDGFGAATGTSKFCAASIGVLTTAWSVGSAATCSDPCNFVNYHVYCFQK